MVPRNKDSHLRKKSSSTCIGKALVCRQKLYQICCIFKATENDARWMVVVALIFKPSTPQVRDFKYLALIYENITQEVLSYIICKDMDGTREHHVGQSKPGSQRQIIRELLFLRFYLFLLGVYEWFT